MACFLVGVSRGISTQSGTAALRRHSYAFMPLNTCRYPLLVPLLFCLSIQCVTLAPCGSCARADKGAIQSPAPFRAVACPGRAVPHVGRRRFVPCSVVLPETGGTGFTASAVKSSAGICTDAFPCTSGASSGRELVRTGSVTAFHFFSPLPRARFIPSVSQLGRRNLTVTLPLPANRICRHALVTSRLHVLPVPRQTLGWSDSSPIAGERRLCSPERLRKDVGATGRARLPEGGHPAITTFFCFPQGVRRHASSQSFVGRLSSVRSGVGTAGHVWQAPGSSRQEETDRQLQQNRRPGGAFKREGFRSTITTATAEFEDAKEVQRQPSPRPGDALWGVRVGHGYDLHRITLNPADATGRGSCVSSACIR